jgi:hypothetical protein
VLPPPHTDPALKGAGRAPDSQHMADEWTRPDDDGSAEGGASARPFDRQALQATLADAVRTASDAGGMDNPPNKPLRGPTTGAPVVPGPSDTEPVLPPRPQPGRSVNPFSRGGSAPEAAPATAAPPAPAARRPPSLLGGGTPTSVGGTSVGGTSVGGSPGAGLSGTGNLGAGSAVPGSGLSGSSLGSPGGAGQSGLRSPSPAKLGPMNLSGDSRVGGDLAAGRSTSALAPAPAAAEQPTIALRRRQPAESAPSARSAEPSAPAAPAQTAPAPPPPRTISIEGWTPGDDDILPRRVLKRSFRRR